MRQIHHEKVCVIPIMSVWSDHHVIHDYTLATLLGACFDKQNWKEIWSIKDIPRKNDIDVWNDGIEKKVDTEFWLDVKWHVFCDMILKIEVLHKQNLV